MLLHIVERIFPGVVAGLYSQGVTTEALARCVNGSFFSFLVVALLTVSLVIFRKQAFGLFQCLDTPKGFLWVVICLSVLSMPDPVRPFLPGLDNSWQWFLNRFALEKIWGNQVVFTYGPLGFLIVPLAWSWRAVQCALGANVLFLVLWVWALFRLYQLSENGRWVAYGLVLSMFVPQPSMEWRWVILAIVLTQTSRFASGCVLAFVSMLKFSALVTVAGTQVFLIAWEKGRGFLRFASGFALTFVVLAAFLFDSPESLIAWFRGSLAVAQGYNLNMISERGVMTLMLPFVFLAVAVWRPTCIKVFLPYAPLLFCTAKYAWVRQGVEPFLYALVVVMSVGLGRLEKCRRRLLLTIVAFVGVVSVFVWPRYFAGNTYCGFPFGLNPMGVVRLLNVANCFEAAARLSCAAVSDKVLPASLRSKVGTHSVQLLPHEFSPAMADPTLAFQPYPILQMYSTYTDGLDSLAADSYRRSGAPTYIAIDLANCTIDGKHLFLENPQTWIAIKENYELVGEEKSFLLLRRRQTPVSVAKKLKLDALPRLSLMGKVRSLFFRGKICRLKFRDPVDGEQWSCRVNPMVLQGPIDEKLVVSPKNYAAYFRIGSNNLKSDEH